VHRAASLKRSTAPAMGFLSFVNEADLQKGESPHIERIIRKRPSQTVVAAAASSANEAKGFLELAKEGEKLDLTFPEHTLLKQTFNGLVDFTRPGKKRCFVFFVLCFFSSCRLCCCSQSKVKSAHVYHIWLFNL
jgi:hypothetical protein